MRSLKGKIVLITGASSGIGRATAFAFAAAGARLLLCARRLELLQQMEAPLREAGAADVSSFRLDVRDRTAVNCGLAKLYQDDPTNWDEMIDTNIKGLLAVTRAVVPGMVARNAGHIINLGSTASHLTYANGAVYCATKAAERVLSEGLKIDLMGTAVRVTSIDPGMVETEFSQVRFRGDVERAAKVYENITPLTPEDIADAILWTASRPAHVNIHSILLTSIDQANSMVFHRHE